MMFALLLIGAPDLFIAADEAKTLLGKPGVVFVCSDSVAECEEESIAGSVFAPARELRTLEDVKACRGLPMCEPRAANVFGALGIDDQTRVIAYDSGVGVTASGMWFLLKLYGHDRVQILDGGTATWKAKGGAVAAGPAAKVAPKKFAAKVRPEMIATIDEVKKAASDPSYLLVDARHDPKEQKRGQIPGAVVSPWTSYAGNAHAEAGKPTLRDATAMKKQVSALKGYAAEKTIITFCHAGIGRASFEYMALLRAGHPKVKLYVGSWSEWEAAQK